ncbi:hypothetical protein [Streptomyces sp. NBC_01565]|uniref:hypothetical protein n=1 Tax=unclassified Streptomyces TaxID=2593676 RepID=UPI00224FA78C|nr:hypothetical protein [Streptomyces sp. NBC_01565]MCX4547037.1 hypothetical protein [Streptomyces sp. NBC_01565]
MGGRQDKRKEPSKGREPQEHHRPGDPAHPQPGKPSRKPGSEESSRRGEDDLLREEDLHDEQL